MKINALHSAPSRLTERPMKHDVIIRLSGDVARRKKKLSKKYYGTSHVLSKEEAKFVVENGCQQLILGSGQMGRRKLRRILRAARSYCSRLAGRDCAADEQKPESALRTSIGRTLVRVDRRRKPPSSRSARGPDRAEPNVRTDVSRADLPSACRHDHGNANNSAMRTPSGIMIVASRSPASLSVRAQFSFASFDCHFDFAMRCDGCHQSLRLSGFNISLLRPSVVSSASAAPD
jgi:hypothetical protein